MDNFLLYTWIFVGFVLFWLASNLIFRWRISMYIGICAIVVFIGFLIMGAVYEDYAFFWPLVYMTISGVFVAKSGKRIPLNTQTAVFNNVTNQPIAQPIRGTGTTSHDPVFERLSVSVDGTPNTAVNLQEVEIEIHETSPIQTKTRGIQVVVRGISFMIHLLGGQVRVLLDIEGGIETVKRRINNHVEQFMQGALGRIEAEKIDQTKDQTIIDLGRNLKTSINDFCRKNRYPFEVPAHEEVVIDDTELDKSYYEALAKEAIAVWTQRSLDVDAKALVKRLVDAGKELLGTGSYSDAERLQAAQISLGIVKKDIKSNKIGFDPDTTTLIKAIAELLKK